MLVSSIGSACICIDIAISICDDRRNIAISRYRYRPEFVKTMEGSIPTSILDGICQTKFSRFLIICFFCEAS